MPLEEYPYRLWPPHPAGGAFFLAFETAERLQAAVPYVKHIRMDDIFVGIIAWKLQVGACVHVQPMKIVCGHRTASFVSICKCVLYTVMKLDKMLRAY